MASVFTITAEDRERFDAMARSQLQLEPTPERSTGKTLGLWVVLTISFVAFYQLYGKPSVAVPAEVAPSDSSNTILAAVGFVVGLLAGLWGFFKLRATQQVLAGPTRAAVSVDGIELSIGTRTSVFPWAGITRVLESEELVAFQFRERPGFHLIPLRALSPEERVQLLDALRLRMSTVPPQHVEPTRYPFDLTDAHRREAKRAWYSWWGNRTSWALCMGGIAVTTASSIPLAISVSFGFGLVATLGLLILFFFVRQLLAKDLELGTITLMVGERARLVGSLIGTGFAWSDVTSWGETEHLIVLRISTTVHPVLRAALPEGVLRLVRERLAHVPRADR